MKQLNEIQGLSEQEKKALGERLLYSRAVLSRYEHDDSNFAKEQCEKHYAIIQQINHKLKLNGVDPSEFEESFQVYRNLQVLLCRFKKAHATIEEYKYDYTRFGDDQLRKNYAIVKDIAKRFAIYEECVNEIREIKKTLETI